MAIGLERRIFTATCKATGERYHYQIRMVWGQKQYRCQMFDGATYYPSLSEAKRVAANAGHLMLAL